MILSNTVTVQIFSFGYRKSGLPNDKSGNGGGFVFDCRHLPNPGREPRYKHLTGLDAEVAIFFQERPVMAEYLRDVFRIIDRAVENYNSRDFKDLMVNFGCTGGQHRSVYSAEKLAAHLRKKGISVIVKHTEMAEIRFKARLAQSMTPKVQPDTKNAGVTSSHIIFCDNRCPFAEFPKDDAIDGSKSCRTFSALWCQKLKEYVTKNAPCSWRYGKRRPKAGW